MGVMACDRNSCSNIMCDICIAGRWYVCDECAAEFAQRNPGNIPDITYRFEDFMATKKSPYQRDRPGTAEEFFDYYRRSRQ